MRSIVQLSFPYITFGCCCCSITTVIERRDMVWSLKGLGIDDGNETHGYVQSSCEIEHQEIKVAQQQCLDRSNTQQYTLTLYCYSLCVIGCRQSTAGLCNCLLTMVLVLFVWRKDSRSEEIVMPRMTSLRFGTWTGPLQICAPESHEP